MTALDIKQRFEKLAAEWHERTDHFSSTTLMVADPAYQEIIAMGWDVVPVILRSLEKEPDHWGWALTVITGEQPIPNEHAGMVGEMARDWVAWGRRKGLL